MNRQWRGIGTYLMVLALVCMLLAFFDEQRQNSVSYSYPQFTKAVEEDQIQSASIQPNQETPTGTVTYQLKDGTQKVTQSTAGINDILDNDHFFSFNVLIQIFDNTNDPTGLGVSAIAGTLHEIHGYRYSNSFCQFAGKIYTSL